MKVNVSCVYQILKRTITGENSINWTGVLSVLLVASGRREKLAGCKSALKTPPPLPVVYSTDRSKRWSRCKSCFVVYLRGDLFYVLPCVILFLCFSYLLALRLPRLGKRELILVLFVRLFDLCLFWFWLWWFCRFPLPLYVSEGFRLLPGVSLTFFVMSITRIHETPTSAP